MNGWVCVQADEYRDGRDKRMNGQINGWVRVWAGGGTECEQVDRWKDGQMGVMV